jgi:hypothetical protein
MCHLSCAAFDILGDKQIITNGSMTADLQPFLACNVHIIV